MKMRAADADDLVILLCRFLRPVLGERTACFMAACVRWRGLASPYCQYIAAYRHGRGNEGCAGVG